MKDQNPITFFPVTPDIRLTVRAEPSSVVLARNLVRYALTSWGYESDLVHDAMLVMSEIVTNAVAAARGKEIRLRCTVQDAAPLLECWDPSPKLPVRCHAPESAETGRGLTIIAAHTEATGTRPALDGQGQDRLGPDARRDVVIGSPPPGARPDKRRPVPARRAS